MQHSNNLSVRSAIALLIFSAYAVFTACDNKPVDNGDKAIEVPQTVINVAWNDVEGSISFTAPYDWSASLAGSESWIKLTKASGATGSVKMPFIITKNDSENYREAKIVLSSGKSKAEVTIHQEANPNAVLVMDKSKIKDYDKYYCPRPYNDGFEKGADYMLRSDAKWSWWRMKQSEHFFVFWMPEFGDDPNSASVPNALRVDVDDLLAKAEQFYETNVKKLGMAEPGKGESRLDQYKMQIYLLYQTEWLATGSGYDDTIGALWVNPSTCKPVGSTIGHEIGHSFQYQVSADKLYNGSGSLTDFGANVGFRYGYGANGGGGCAYWEQCAQWQSFQDYPQEAFGYDVNVWLANHHRSFLHEWHRYASYWFQFYFTQVHGIKAFSQVWRESKYPEDPLQAYMRLFCNDDLNTFYEEYFSYAQHCAAYDFDAVHQYATDAAKSYTTHLFKNEAGNYQVAYDNCPGTTGFNLIPLNCTPGKTIKADFAGIEPGSALVAEDPGQLIDGDGKVVKTVKSYNKTSNMDENFRYGFVSVDAAGNSTYSQMYSGTSGVAEFDVPNDAAKVYFVVVGTPDTYKRQAWDDNGENDEQWPYEVSFVNTDLLGNVILPEGDPEDCAIEHEVKLDSSIDSYVLGSMNLLDNGDMITIAKAFKLQPAAISALTLSEVGAAGPADGQVALGLTQPDGTVSYAYSANGLGFWCTADGSTGSWGASDPVYFEYDATTYKMEYGHRYGVTSAGAEYTVKPTMVYNKGGKLYKAVISLKMAF
ncbi:MAG: DUF6055 domain-containing protein [Bacteroidales bacterium]|nr:DUF6055 domain-containing protein [Bacteroidales bacterium]